MREFFDLWLDTDGYQCCDLLDIMKSWWELRNEPNVLLLHYAELKKDLPGQIARLAEFFSIDSASLRMDAIVEHSSFDYMSGKAERRRRLVADTCPAPRPSSTKARSAISAPS